MLNEALLSRSSTTAVDDGTSQAEIGVAWFGSLGRGIRMALLSLSDVTCRLKIH